MSASIPGRQQAASTWRAPGDPVCTAPAHFETPAANDGEARVHALLRTVETEIIPRLMLLHRQPQDPPAASPAPATSQADASLPSFDAEAVERFTDRLLQSQAAALVDLRNLADRGVPAAALCLNLMAPAARRLGELWTADLCDFTQVTIALGRLHALLHVVSGDLPSIPVAEDRRLTALLAQAPGEQHTLGLSMVKDFFRAAGWDVWAETPASTQALIPLVRSRHFDVVGFSIGSERHVDALAALIADIRRASVNRRLTVLAGGPLMLAQPELLSRLGADATGEDARQAILVAHDRVGQQD